MRFFAFAKSFGVARARMVPRFLRWLFFVCAVAMAWPSTAGEVRIEGLSDELLDNARLYLQLYQRRDDPKLSERWRRRLFADGVEQIRLSLQPFGYYKPDVQSAMEAVEGGWRAVYRVQPGVPAKVSSTRVKWIGSGAERPELIEAAAGFPLQKGAVFVHRQYEDAKTALLDAAYDLGYVKVKIAEALVRVDPDAASAAIELTLDTGGLFRYGRIRLHQESLSPELLAHYVTLEEGQPFSNRQLLEFQQQLIATGWFAVVEVKPDFAAAADGLVPIEVHCAPAKKHKLEFGLGFATDVGPRGSARWTNKRVNRHGHQMGANLQLAAVKGTLSANYQIPVRNPRTDRLAFTSTYEYEDLSDSERDTFNLEAAFLRSSLDNRNVFKLFGEYRYEQFSAGLQQDSFSNLLSVGGIVRRTVAEEAEFLRNGYSVSADLRLGSSVLLSDTSFLRGDFTGIYLYPIGSNGRLNLRGEIGLAWVETFDKYPTSLRFFAGGDQSVRGYGYKDLGPRDSAGLNPGGKNLLVGSLEYDHRIVGKWVGAVFVDAGNAFNDTLDKVYVGAGGGIRWLAPFGSLRLDVGWPVSENAEFADFQIHIGLGAVL